MYDLTFIFVLITCAVIPLTGLLLFFSIEPQERRHHDGDYYDGGEW
jgi:hypothetical protein